MQKHTATSPVRFVECCGVIVPIANNRHDEEEAYRQFALGGILALSISLPIAAAIFLYSLA